MNGRLVGKKQLGILTGIFMIIHSSDLYKAMEKAQEFNEPYEKIGLGVIFKSDRPTYEDSEPIFKKGPLVDQPLGLDKEIFEQLLAETM